MKFINFNGKNYLDLTGKVFERLTVVGIDYERMNERVSSGVKSKLLYWLCKCSCGNEELKSIRDTDLFYEKVRSCGCINKENRKRPDRVTKRLAKIYSDMIQRCYNKNNSSYKSYGAKGVKVTKKWKDDANEFYKWALENGYRNDLSIDRIDPYKNYTPRNCRWVTMEKQANNKRNTVFITINNEKKSISEWAKNCNITVDEFYKRLKKGYTIKDACTKIE